MVKPKGKVSAWFFFLKDEREALKKANTGETMNRKKFMSEVGAKWADMKDKSKYEAKANKDAERFEKEMASYEPEDDKKTNPGNFFKDFCRKKLF